MTDEKSMNEGVAIAKTFQNVYFLHKWINNGGSFRFKNYPFAIKLVGNGSAMIEVQLIAIPVNTEYSGHINPSLTKAKKEEKQMEIVEDAEIEM